MPRIADHVNLRGRRIAGHAFLRPIQSKCAELVPIVVIIGESAKCEKTPELVALEFELGATPKVAGQ